MPKTVPKGIQTCFEHVLGHIFRKIIAQFSMEGRVFENFPKNKKFQSSKKAKNLYQNCPNVFWTCFGANFSNRNFCPVFHVGSRLLNFEKSRKILKIANMPKIDPKFVQMCFEHVLRQFFRKFFSPVFHGGSRLRKFSKKFKKRQNSKKVQNRSQKCPKSFEHVSGQIFAKKFFAQCSMVARDFEKFQKKSKKIQNSKNTQNHSQKKSKSVLNMFWGNFFRKISAQFSMEGRLFQNYQKKPRIFKVPKKPKIDTKSVQTCFEHASGQIFPKKKLPSVPWRLETSKSWKKFKKNSIFRICPKSFPKVPKSVLGWFFWKFFSPVFHGGSRLRKISKKFEKRQNSKNVQNRSQMCSKMFWGNFFENFLAQCSMEARDFENFQKSLKNVKLPKKSKIVPKSVQKSFEHVSGQILAKKFFAQCSMVARDFEKFQKKSKKIQNSKNTQNHSQKKSKSVLNMFWGNFFRKISAQFSTAGRIFENFQKKNIFKIPKMPKSFPKSIQTCFEHVLGKIFWKIFAQLSMECRVFKNFRKKNIFKIPKLPKSVPKSIQKCFGVIFLKKFYAQCSMEGRVFENFQKFFFSKFQKNWKSFPKVEIFKKIKKFSKFQK